MKKLLLFFLGAILLLTFFLNKSQQSTKQTFTPQQKSNQEQPDVTTFATNLEIPWSLVFLPDERILITERPGKIKLISKNGSDVKDILTIADVKHAGEGGLMGMTLHPDFRNNKYIYLYYTFDNQSQTMNKVVRYVFKDDKLINPQIIIGNIPGSFFHNGGRIKFGPDKLLYITTGDSQNESSSQDENSLAGKILRVDEKGNTTIFSYGHRNPQGLDWLNGMLYITEHGPSGGLNCCKDEINLVEEGKNYGWPQSVGDKVEKGTISPLLHSGTDTWAPSGSTFYNGKLFFAGLRGTALYEFNPADKTLKTHFKNEFGRIRDVVLGPDNYLYILTNNRDGRGVQRSGDDKIIRINPEKFF